MRHPIIPTLVLILMAVAPRAGADQGVGATGEGDFDGEVGPILIRRCLGCHSGPEPKGKLDLTTRPAALKGGTSGASIVPGRPEESLLWEHVEGDAMPPKEPLPVAEKARIEAWIAAGAPWGTGPLDPSRFTTSRRAGRDWWSLQPVERPSPPEVRDAGWARNPIDAFVLAGLQAKGLKPSPTADRRTLVRRLAFDLTGLPPSPEEVEEFLADGRPDAYELLVDRDLASPQYGVRQARPWLDLARFAESNGFEFDEFRPHAWPYRDWVVDALNRDMPYDEFARLQLAGDVLRPDDPGAIEATGFLVAGAYDSPGQKQQSQAMRKVVRQDEMEDIVGTVGQAFLGLTVHCARCHDHKFDPIAQFEYYRLSAALSGVRHGERDLSDLDPSLQAENRRIAELGARVADLEGPIRSRLSPEETPPPGQAPTPIARWDFTQDAKDRVGALHGTLEGSARLAYEGLKVDGASGFVVTAPLAEGLGAKTLEAWVRLDNLAQRGAGVMGVQTLNGVAYDSIVLGEREAGRWMAGRGEVPRPAEESFGGPEESEAERRPVHVAIAYAEDGTISAYRDGRPYGTPYRAARPRTFGAGQAQVVFGLTHGAPGGGKMLAGRIVRARLYDRALDPEEVAASARAAGEDVPQEAIEAELPPDRRAEWARLIAELDARKATFFGRTRKAYVVSPEPPGPAHRLVRGDPSLPAEVVTAGGVASLSGPDADFGLSSDAPDPERRIRLASWIANRRNPLFARVIVNRLWQSHFGVGLVETPSDFGFNGGRPSHPELLDWLASELIERGWSQKHIHRLIVTSASYRQASRPDAKAARIDASGRLFWRKAPLRMEAEMVRDAMLAVSGALDPKLGGPGFREFSIAPAPGTPAILYAPIEASGPEFDRRTLYRTWARGGRNSFLDAFDCPDPSTTAPRRASTTTPLQALALLNNALTLRLSDRLSDRLRREVGDDHVLQVERAYRLAFGRPPDPEERERARQVVAEYGPSALARAIFNSNEFLYID